MARTRFSVATCNLYKLNRPGLPMYRDPDGWGQEAYAPGHAAPTSPAWWHTSEVQAAHGHLQRGLVSARQRVLREASRRHGQRALDGPAHRRGAGPAHDRDRHDKGDRCPPDPAWRPQRRRRQRHPLDSTRPMLRVRCAFLAGVTRPGIAMPQAARKDRPGPSVRRGDRWRRCGPDRAPRYGRPRARWRADAQ